jgi:hypothetical protein
MVPSSAVFTVAQPTVGIGAISSDYTAPAGLATYSPSIFFDSLVFDLNNYLTEYYYPIQDIPGSSFGQYVLDGYDTGAILFDQYIASGSGSGQKPNALFVNNSGGNWTIPANDSDFFTQYVSTFEGSGPTPGPSIRYQVAKTTTVYDGDFYVKTFGYGDQDIEPTNRVNLPAGSYPTSRPLTAFGYRPGSNRTVGWGKTGRYRGNPFNTLGFIYENATVNGFQVYAWRRCVYGAFVAGGYSGGTYYPAVCDLYLLIGHPRWNSVFGTVTFASSEGTAQQSSQLKMSGSTNVLAVTMLLCKQEQFGTVSTDIPVANLQTIVQNLTARMKLFFYF